MAGVGRWRVVLAGLLALPLMLAGPAVGRADAQDAAWYLPRTWVEVLAGTWEAARDALTAGVGAAVSAGDSPLSLREGPSTTGTTTGVYSTGSAVTCRGTWEVVTSSPLVLREVRTGTSCYTGVAMSGTVAASPSGSVSVAASGAFAVSGGSVLYTITSTAGKTSFGIPVAAYQNWSGSSWVFTYLRGFVYTFAVGQATTTTTVICRPAAGGADFPVTESATGVTVAPAPVCPAGSYPVRHTVSNTTDGVVSDASISAPGWYMGDPESWEFEKFQQGLRCVDGTPTCDAVWDEDTDSCMAYNHTTGEYREVVDAVCQGAAGDGFLSGGGAAETPDDPDQGIINRSLEAIRSAIDKAKTAIVGGLAAAARTVAGAVDAVRSAVDAVRSAVSAAAEQAAADAAAARAKLDSILDGIAGLGQAISDLPGRIGEALTPSSGAMGAQIGRMGDAVTGKFAPWTAVAEDYAGAFAVSGSCSCLGPPLKLPAAMGGHTVYPASSCGHLAPFAAASKTFTAAVLLVGCAAAVLHFIMTAFGFVSPIGRAAARVGGPGAQAGRGTLDSSGTVSSGTVDWDLIADRDASIPKSQRDASPLWKS